MRAIVFLLPLLSVFTGCSVDDEQPDDHRVTFTYEFSSGPEGWSGDFADYPAGEEEFYELNFEHSQLPDPLNLSDGALKLSGINHSDDLFMYVRKEVRGLIPNKEYRLNFWVEFASNVAEGQFGIGGSPGESVYIKAGAASAEPEKYLDEEDWYRLNIDKGNQASGGDNMMVLGNFSNGTDKNVYTLKTLSTTAPIRITANSVGSLWLLFGVDSGFEGETTIYINRISVELF